MYTLTSVHVEGDNLLLTLATPIATFDQLALQRLIDLLAPAPPVNANPVPASRRRAQES
jgi:hypothetical protein